MTDPETLVTTEDDLVDRIYSEWVRAHSQWDRDWRLEWRWSRKRPVCRVCNRVVAAGGPDPLAKVEFHIRQCLLTWWARQPEEER